MVYNGVMVDTPYNPMEQEAIILQAVWELIDDMVNYAIFEKSHGTIDAELMFKNSEGMKLFVILLADFLSKPRAETFNLPATNGNIRTDHTYLFYLTHICKNPQLNTESDCLLVSVQAFSDWLEEEGLIEKVWLASIQLETDIRVQRILLLKICGDTIKHSFPRLEANVKRIVKMLGANGHEISEGQGFQILPDLKEWFYDDIFEYHSNTIAEFLNNIRWGIYEYLRPEYERSIEWTGSEPYECRFNPPPEFGHTLATSMYWNLMNRERMPPWFPRIAVTEWRKKRY